MSEIPSLSRYRREADVRWLVDALSPFFVRRGEGVLPRPGKVHLRSRQLTGVPNMPFEIFATLPPAANPADVAKRVLTVAVDGGPEAENDVDPAVTEFKFPANYEVGQKLTGALMDVDAAGNKSAPSVFDYTVTDTTPPDQPGPITFRSVQVA